MTALIGNMAAKEVEVETDLESGTETETNDTTTGPTEVKAGITVEIGEVVLTTVAAAGSGVEEVVVVVEADLNKSSRLSIGAVLICLFSRRTSTASIPLLPQ